MANLRYAPEFSIRINGSRVPAALRASISSATLQTGLEGADRVELEIVNENLRWLDHALLKLDNDLTLLLGYAPDPLTQLFVGEIVSQSATFPASGTPTLTVAAQDRMSKLTKGTKARWFAIPTPSVGNFALPDPLVAGIVSLENGLIPIIDPVGAALSVILGQVETLASAADPDSAQRLIRKQEAESDHDFLKRISRENGWEMFIDHSEPGGGHKLRFQSPLDRLTPEVTLKYGHSLIDFTPRISTVGQIVSVTVYVWVAQIKTTFTVTVGWDWDRMALTVDIRPAVLQLQSGPSRVLIEEPVTVASAPRRIISELIPRLNQRLTGSGSTIGDPRIQAGTVLRLEGLGVQFGGLYRVTSATHTIDSSGYRTRFNVRKEIWFGSIPPVDQGAVPVKVKAPFL
jgi:uncharacterized protein